MANEDTTTKRVSTELDLDVSSFVKKTETAVDSAEKLEKEIKGLQDELKKMGKDSEEAGKKVESSLNGVIPKLLGFAAVTKVMKASWQNTIAMEQSVTELNYTLGQSSKIVTQFAQDYSRALNISEMEILGISASLSTMLKNILDNENAIARLSNTMIMQIERISSVTGRTNEEIARRYEQLIRGNLNAFRDFGINTQREYLEMTETFQKYANGKQWEDLTRNEQTQIAIIETMIQVDQRFAESADTTMGKVGQLQARWENLTTTLGGFLSIATPILDFFSSILETATDGFEGLQMLGDGMQYVVIGGIAFVTFAPSILKGLQALFLGSMKASTGFMMLGASILYFTLLAASAFKRSQEDTTEQIEDQTEAIEDETEATKDLEEAREGLMGIDEINTLSGGNSTSLTEEDYSQDKNSDWVNDYLSQQEELQASLDETIRKTEEEMAGFQTLMTVIMGVVGAYSAMRLIIKAVTAVMDAKKAKTLEATLAAKQQQLQELQNAQASQQAAAATQQEAAADTQAAAAQKAKTAADTAGTAASGAAVAASTATAAAANAEATAELGAAAGHAAKNTAASWGTWAAIGLPLIAGIIGGVVAYASTIKMARGGVVNQPTYAEIGEGVYHEAVIPLGNSPEWNDTKEDLGQYLVENGGGGGTTTVNTVVELNGREIVKAISEDMHDDWRRRGWL